MPVDEPSVCVQKLADAGRRAPTGMPYRAQVLNGNGADMLRACLRARGCWHLIESGEDRTEWNLWFGNNGQSCPFQRFQNRADTRRRLANRLPKNRELCTKARLAYHLQRHMAELGEQLPAIPQTFTVTAKVQIGNEQQRLQEAAAVAAAAGKGDVWIVKPTSLNRGMGIAVVRGIDNALAHVNAKGVVGSTWVVQKYIERPLLIRGRKFDIRSYALVTPDKRVYFHEESYVRTSGVAFSLNDLEDRSIHLTNDAVQRKAAHYDSFESHNKLSMSQLQAALAAEGRSVDIEGCVVPQMRDAAAHAFNAAYPAMASSSVSSCFELMGLDFMIDESGQAYLIEVNTCPALACHGAVLQDLLPRVMEEVVQKAIDPLFPPLGGRASSATAALAVQGCTSDATDASDGASESSKGRTPRSDGAGGGCEAGGLPAKLDGFKLLLGRLPTRRAQIDRSASLQITSKETAAGAFSGVVAGSLRRQSTLPSPCRRTLLSNVSKCALGAGMHGSSADLARSDTGQPQNDLEAVFT